MIKMAIYTDGPQVVGRNDVVKLAYLYNDSTSTPTDIVDGTTVIYKVATLNLSALMVGGYTIEPDEFLNNMDKFTYANGTLTFIGVDLTYMRKIATLDMTIPLSCLRANTVVNLGRL